MRYMSMAYQMIRIIMPLSFLLVIVVIFFGYIIYLRTGVFVMNDALWNPYNFGGIPSKFLGTGGYRWWDLIYVGFDTAKIMIFHNPIGTLAFVAMIWWLYRKYNPKDYSETITCDKIKTTHLIRKWFIWIVCAIYYKMAVLTSVPAGIYYDNRYEIFGRGEMALLFWTFIGATLSIFLPIYFVYLLRATYSEIDGAKSVLAAVRSIRRAKSWLKQVRIGYIVALTILAEIYMLYGAYQNFAVSKGWLIPVETPTTYTVRKGYDSGDIQVQNSMKTFEEKGMKENSIYWNPYLPSKIYKMKWEK